MAKKNSLIVNASKDGLITDEKLSELKGLVDVYAKLSIKASVLDSDNLVNAMESVNKGTEEMANAVGAALNPVVENAIAKTAKARDAIFVELEKIANKNNKRYEEIAKKLTAAEKTIASLENFREFLKDRNAESYEEVAKLVGEALDAQKASEEYQKEYSNNVKLFETFSNVFLNAYDSAKDTEENKLLISNISKLREQIEKNPSLAGDPEFVEQYNIYVAKAYGKVVDNSEKLKNDVFKAQNDIKILADKNKKLKIVAGVLAGVLTLTVVGSAITLGVGIPKWKNQRNGGNVIDNGNNGGLLDGQVGIDKAILINWANILGIFEPEKMTDEQLVDAINNQIEVNSNGLDILLDSLGEMGYSLFDYGFDLEAMIDALKNSIETLKSDNENKASTIEELKTQADYLFTVIRSQLDESEQYSLERFDLSESEMQLLAISDTEFLNATNGWSENDVQRVREAREIYAAKIFALNSLDINEQIFDNMIKKILVLIEIKNEYNNLTEKYSEGLIGNGEVAEIATQNSWINQGSNSRGEQIVSYYINGLISKQVISLANGGSTTIVFNRNSDGTLVSASSSTISGSGTVVAKTMTSSEANIYIEENELDIVNQGEKGQQDENSRG